MKSHHRWFILGSLVLAPAWLQLGGCRDSLKTCEDTLTCEPDDVGSGGETSSGGESGATGGQGGGMAGGGAGGADPCESCSEEEPVCKDESVCVQCTESETEACPMEQPLCDPDSNECVACLENEHCTDSTMPLCVEGECAPCTDNLSCGDLGNHCLPSGACVECTPETDDRETTDDDCGDGVCDPETNECDSGLTQKDKGVCEACIADSECPTDYNCVPMEFQDEPRSGGYCLRTVASGACSTNPFRSPTDPRESLSGTPSQSYCGINEDFTTCEAVLHLRDDEDCLTADDCGAPGLDDGLCETVSTVEFKCTYACDSPAQCRSSDPGSGCDGDAQGDAVTYCGG